MKTIGLLGGTAWPSTIDYYTSLNKKVHSALGGFNSAKIILKSINYHEIMTSYGVDNDHVCQLLKDEVSGLLSMKPDCFMICCNSLHKFYDIIEKELNPKIPMIHALNETASYIKSQRFKKVLLLAAKFTMEDGFFANKINEQNIDVTIPNKDEVQAIHKIHRKFDQGGFSQSDKDYFSSLTDKYKDYDAVVLGCTEFPLLLDEQNSCLKIVNPTEIQTNAAVKFSLSD